MRKMANEKETKLNETFDSESNPPRRTAEEWRKLEKEMIERDARHRNSSTINVPKVPGQ